MKFRINYGVSYLFKFGSMRKRVSEIIVCMLRKWVLFKDIEGFIRLVDFFWF